MSERTPETDAAAVEEFLRYSRGRGIRLIEEDRPEADTSMWRDAPFDIVAQWLASRQPAEPKATDKSVFIGGGSFLWTGPTVADRAAAFPKEPRAFAVGDVVEWDTSGVGPESKSHENGKVVDATPDASGEIECRFWRFDLREFQAIRLPPGELKLRPGPFPKNAAGEEEWWR